jgi:ubiquinone/menaquinone biosynthesis C-methylase UbiE
MTQAVPRPWQLAGDMANNYERYFVPAIFEPWATDLLNLVPPQESDRVLDLACATGIVARLASKQVGPTGKVVGLDLNPAMLAIARSAAPTDALIEWQQGNAEDMPFPDEAFDLVLCQQGLQFFPNKDVALREMHRVLAPGGRLALSVWCDIQRIPGYAALAEALARHAGPEAAGFMQMTGSVSAEQLKNLFQASDFQEVHIRSKSRTLRFSSAEAFVWEMVQCTPLAWMASVNQADESTRATVVNELLAKLQPYLQDGGLTFPIEASVATAQKAGVRKDA